MSVPNQIDDGNWDLLPDIEGLAYEFPFGDKGDFVTFKASVPRKQDIGRYQGPLAPMSVKNFPLGKAYLTKPGNPRNNSCGLFEWDDTYSSVPVGRKEYGSFAFTIQWWRLAVDGNVDPDKYFYSINYDIEEQTFTVQAEIEYEYFLNVAPVALLHPRVFLLFGQLQQIGGSPVIGQRVIAEDSQVSIYECKIFERRTIYALTRIAVPVP